VLKILAAIVHAGPPRLWAMILSGPPLTLFAAGMVWIIWKGPWPIAMASQQLVILGWGLWILLGLIGVIIVSLASAKVKATGFAGSIDIEGDDDDPPAQPGPPPAA
jgi:hypothetical protein